MDATEREAACLLLRWLALVREHETARVERALDDAVAGTLPCSDPIVSSCLRERIDAIGGDAVVILTLGVPPALVGRVEVSGREAERRAARAGCLTA